MVRVFGKLAFGRRGLITEDMVHHLHVRPVCVRKTHQFVLTNLKCNQLFAGKSSCSYGFLLLKICKFAAHLCSRKYSQNTIQKVAAQTKQPSAVQQILQHLGSLAWGDVAANHNQNRRIAPNLTAGVNREVINCVP